MRLVDFFMTCCCQPATFGSQEQVATRGGSGFVFEVVPVSVTKWQLGEDRLDFRRIGHIAGAKNKRRDATEAWLSQSAIWYGSPRHIIKLRWQRQPCSDEGKETFT